MKRRPPPQTLVVKHIYVPPASSWDWLWIVAFVALLGLVLYASLYHWHPSAYHVHPAVDKYTPGSGVAGAYGSCARGEQWSQELELCAPESPIPVAVVPEIYDLSTPDCTSFYQKTCGTWIAEHENQDRSFGYASRRNDAVLTKLVHSPSSGPLYRLYRSCLDTLVYRFNAKEDNLQRQHVLDDVLRDLHSMADLPVIFGRLARYGFTGPFSLSIERYPTKPLLVPLIRPDSFSFAVTEPNVTELYKSAGRIRLPPARLRALVEMVTTMSGWITPSAEPSDYAGYIASRLERDTYTFGELMDMTNAEGGGGDVFWIQYLRELDGHALDTMTDAGELVWIPDVAYFQRLFRESGFSLQQWQDYVTLSVLEGTARFSPQLMSNVYFKLHDRAPMGPHVKLEHRMKRNHSIDTVDDAHCVKTAHSLLPGATAHYYLQQLTEQHGEDLRATVMAMTSNLRDTFCQLIDETDWMDDETKAKATEKIRSMIIRAVHPTHWDRNGVEPFAERITQDRWLRNLNMIRRYRSERNYALWKARDPLDRDALQRFGRPLSEINAFYSPVTNTITIFAGILTPPFYDAQFSVATAYARIGSVIGHEMSHGLDNNGRLFDAQGSFANWWSAESTAGFLRRAQLLAAEYPAPVICNHSVDYGQQTLGEAIADSVGVTLAYRAFLKTPQGQTVTPEEKRNFFRAYSQMWCSSYTTEHMCRRVATDEHAVPHLRVDKTLRQFPVFKQAFGCSRVCGMVNDKGAVAMYGRVEELK